MKTLLAILFTSICLLSHAQEDKLIKGHTGGMMLHTGYLNGYDNPYNYKTAGSTLGIGGLFRLHFTEHFRAGIEGYVSTMKLNNGVEKGSFNKQFWTGLLFDWNWKVGRFYPYVGASAGGGVETSFYMFEGNRNDWEPEADAVFHKEPYFAIDPFVGVEYELKSAIRLTVKLDYLLAFDANKFNKPSGPRLYFGFIFAH